MWIYCYYLLWWLVVAVVSVNAQPGGGRERNIDLDSVETNIDGGGGGGGGGSGSGAAILEEEKSNQMKLMQLNGNRYNAYSDGDLYYGRPQLPLWRDSYEPVNDLTSTSSIRHPLNAKPMKSFVPWYAANQMYADKPINGIPMYPSRSYDPYIRRYDRYDEQYYRAYPQYFEDMYIHRQRYDPHDSYSPRTPQHPEPYNLYPDRYLDTPKDYVMKFRGGGGGNNYGGYGPDPSSSSMSSTIPSSSLSRSTDIYNSKYRQSDDSLSMDVRPKSERVIYYAHLPEIVRTPYELEHPADDRSSYKLNKKKLKNTNNVRSIDNNSTNYKLS